MNHLLTIQPGAHLVINNLLYQHHGLYLGDGLVMHYAGMGNHSLDFSNSHIQTIELKAFIADAQLSIRPHKPHAFATDKIIQRAYSRLGEDEYNLITNNCEHFVNWCIYGKSESQQVRSVVETIIKISTKQVLSQPRRPGLRLFF